MFERFRRLCQKKGVLPTQALKDLNLSTSTATNWKTRNSLPSGEVTVKMANYFNVSCDYILGMTEKELIKKEPTAEDIAEQIIVLSQKLKDLSDQKKKEEDV